MKAYRLLLGLLAVCLIAAIVAWAISSDPGYVMIQRGGWVVESSLVFAVLFVLATIGATWAIVGALRWPMVAMIRKQRRDARLQFVRGSLALAEGRPQRAETALARAARTPSLRIPALLGVHAAAGLRGDAKKRDDAIDKLAAIPDAGVIATVLRARRELAEGKPGAAIELLGELERTERLPPAGMRIYVEALVTRGRAREALGSLSRLRRGNVMPAAEFDRFESGVLAEALRQTSDAQSLRGLWSELNRNQRRDAIVASAYSRRAAALGLVDASPEIEGILRKHWSEELVLEYAVLPGDPAERLRAAETFLRDHPESPALQLALGRLCGENALWGKAEAHLQRALALGLSAPAWEALGRIYTAQGDFQRGARAYANAVATARGEAPQVVTPLDGASLATVATVLEERDAHGVPRLPGR